MAKYDASIVNASPEVLAALASVPDPGPFIMLNLLRYRGETGPEAYGRYAQVAGREIAKLGGDVVYSAPALPGPHGGDMPPPPLRYGRYSGLPSDPCSAVGAGANLRKSTRCRQQ